MKFIKNSFKKIYKFVNSHRQWGLIIIIAVVAGGLVLLYDVEKDVDKLYELGKDVGEFIYSITEK